MVVKSATCEHEVVMYCDGTARVIYDVKVTAAGDLEVKPDPAIDWLTMDSSFECAKCGESSRQELGISNDWEWL